MCDEVPPLNAYAHARLRLQRHLVDGRDIAVFSLLPGFFALLASCRNPRVALAPVVARGSEGPCIAACGFNFVRVPINPNLLQLLFLKATFKHSTFIRTFNVIKIQSL